MRLIIDTDPGMGSLGTDPEDGLAILYALGSPDVTVEGITLVQGNVPISHSWPNASHLLALADREDVPLHAGAVEPLEPERRGLQTAWLAYRSGLRRISPDAEEPSDTASSFLVESVDGSPGDITIVAIGPLTNVARAVEADPSFAESLAGLTIMGGTVASPGNITPAAEFNIWADPEAARIVFDSGAPITMVGLDVCHQTRFEHGHVAQLRGLGTPLAVFAADSSEPWMETMSHLGDEAVAGLHLYDSLAVAAAIEPDLLEYRTTVVEVETGTGPAQGMTVTHLNDELRQLLTGGREPNARVAVGVDVDRFMRHFADRVLSCL